MANAIFISYRRDDSEGESGRLFDDLVRAFGNDSVFMDVAGIQPGADFRKAIEENVASCGVLLAMIGPAWATIANTSGQRRLDDPNDFVVLEIGSALKRSVPVIPVLVHDARMPSPDALPEPLKDFSYRNSVELSHARWNSDVHLLIQALAAYVKPNASTIEEPVHATVPVQLPAPHPQPVAKPKSKLPLILGIAAVVLIALLAVIFFLSRTPGSTPDDQTASTPATTAPATATPLPATAANADDGSALDGVWIDPTPRTTGNSLVSFKIVGSGKNMSFKDVTANCASGPCDWGSQPADFAGISATATFTPATANDSETRTAQVVAHIVSDGLDVVVNNTFTGPNGTRTNQFHRVFVPGT